MGLLSTHDFPVCLHGSSVPLSAQITAAYPIDQIPLSEYLVNMMDRAQLFLKYPLYPKDGCLSVGDAPGCQMDVDDDKVERESVTEL